MLELLVLVYICRKIGDLADQKGLKRGTWQFLTVVAWFAAEFIGAFVGLLIVRTEDFAPLYFFAWVFAIASYFIMRSIISKKPDVVNPTFEFEQQTEQVDHSNN